MGASAAGRRRRAAFTLIEVMAAVAILGLLSAALVRAASEGMGAEGDARRRLEASLLADRVLLELQASWRAGAPIEPGRQEQQRDLYTVLVDVVPFEAQTYGLEALLEPPELPEGAETPDRSRRRQQPEPPELLTPGDRGEPAPLAYVHVVVSWQEAGRERAVARSTFALDRQAAAPLLEGLAEEGGPGGLPEELGGAPPPGAEVPR